MDGDLWLEASPIQKEKLQKVLFPKGVAYKGEKFGTTVTGSIFNTLELTITRESSRATRHGFEP
jgi:hypothetical protein